MSRPASSRLFLVHGFTQTPAAWDAAAEPLRARGYEVDAVDAPATDLWGAADALAAHGHGAWVGYSMGGRMALHLALAHPHLVGRLVLVSATAGIDDAETRAARVVADEALAQRAEAIGADAFVAEWVAQPMFAGVPPLPRCDDVATITAHLRLAGQGAQASLWSRLGDLTMPVLVVAGARDEKYGALAERLRAAIPHAELEIVADAGHAVPFERPTAFADLVHGWLDAH